MASVRGDVAGDDWDDSGVVLGITYREADRDPLAGHLVRKSGVFDYLAVTLP